MKKQTSPILQDNAAVPRSRALIAVPVLAPRRGLFATLLRAIVLILLLPVRLPVLALLGLARGAAAIGRGAGLALVGLARLVAAPFVLGGRLLRGLARLLAAGIVGAAKGIGWLLLLPVRIVVLLARGLALLGKGLGRGVVLLVRGLARTLVFVLKLPFLVLRGAGLGLAAVAVPAGAVLWGGVRAIGAGFAAAARGIGIVLAFAGRLLGRGVALLARGVYATFAALAVGIFVCVRWILRLAFRIAVLPFVAMRVIAIALARGARNGAALFLHAAIVVGVGLLEIARGTVALVRHAAPPAGRATRSAATALATREPRTAMLLPLAPLAILGLAELVQPGGFPFGTLAQLLLGACALLALLSRPTGVLAVLLVWAFAVGAAWRAESIGLDTPAWIDALVYIVALAGVRAAYVAARAFVRETPVAIRDASQERAHRRASRAIALVLLVQGVAFALWSAAQGRLLDAPLFGELLLVGAGMALAWVVRSGHYVGLAQFVLTLAALVAIVVTIFAQLHAFAAGRVFTAGTIGAGAVLMMMTAALTVVVHTRLIDAEHGA